MYGSFCEFTARQEYSSWLLSPLVGSRSEASDTPHAGNPTENGVTSASQVSLDYFFFLSDVLRAWMWFLPLLWNWSALIAGLLDAVDKLIRGQPHGKRSSSVWNPPPQHYFSTHLVLDEHLDSSVVISLVVRCKGIKASCPWLMKCTEVARHR